MSACRRVHFVLLIVLLSYGDTPLAADEAMKRLPRRPLNTLKNVRLSIAVDNWTVVERSATAPQEFEREIRRRIAKAGFWAPPSKSALGNQPEIIIVLSADDLGDGGTILMLHAVLIETVTIGSSAAPRRAVTWYGRPWFGASYPRSLPRVVRQGKDFVIADLAEFVNYQ